MGDLTAIDILIDPEDSMKELARSVNQRMLKSIPPPTGFALDEHHQPHITTLQRYVHTDELSEVSEAVKGVIDSMDLSTVTFSTLNIQHLPVAEGVGEAAVVVKPAAGVIEFQHKLMDALGPYIGSGGGPDAYVRTDAEPDINDATLNYVDQYVPTHSGDNYIAHVTVGLARLDDLTLIEAKPVEPLTFGPSSVSVYQLGNGGTAAKHLKSWSV